MTTENPPIRLRGSVSALLNNVTKSLHYSSGTPSRLGQLLGVALATILGYSLLASLWIPEARMNVQRIFFCELPIVFFLLAVCVLATQRWRRTRLSLAVATILALYAVHDVFFIVYRASPTSSSFYDLPLLYQVEPKLFIVTIAVLALIIAAFCAALLFRNNYLVPRLIACGLLALALQSGWFLAYAERVIKVLPKETRTITKNGRITIFLFNSLKERQAVAKLHDFIVAPAVAAEIPTIKKRKNLYIVVLESYLNPFAVTGLPDLSANPRLSGQKQWFDSANVSVSPVYGGNTPQAEFEILTGVPAYREVGSIEFNSLTSGAPDSFVRLLKGNGYRTVAQIATTDLYFKGSKPYRALGFDEVSFLDGLKRSDEPFLPDDLFYAANLDTIRKLAASGENYLFYSLGVYGHYPFERNLTREPEVFIGGDREMQDAVNLSYYRTEYLQSYLQAIRLMDPKALILVVSDHLPSSFPADSDYRLGLHDNFVKIIDAGEELKFPVVHHYELPYLLAQRLQVDYPLPTPELLHQRYSQIHAAALR